MLLCNARSIYSRHAVFCSCIAHSFAYTVLRVCCVLVCGRVRSIFHYFRSFFSYNTFRSQYMFYFLLFLPLPLPPPPPPLLVPFISTISLPCLMVGLFPIRCLWFFPPTIYILNNAYTTFCVQERKNTFISYRNSTWHILLLIYLLLGFTATTTTTMALPAPKQTFHSSLLSSTPRYYGCCCCYCCSCSYNIVLFDPVRTGAFNGTVVVVQFFRSFPHSHRFSTFLPI